MPCFLQMLEVFVKVFEYLPTGGTLMSDQLLPLFNDFGFFDHLLPLLLSLLLRFLCIELLPHLLSLSDPILLLLLPPEPILLNLPPLLLGPILGLFLQVFIDGLSPGIPLLDNGYQIPHSRNVFLAFFQPFFFVFFHHLSLDVSVFSLFDVVLVGPREGLERIEGLPVIIELHDILRIGSGGPEAHILLIFSLLLIVDIPVGPVVLVGLPLLLLDQLKQLPVDRVEPLWPVLEALETVLLEVGLDIKTECLHFELLCGHFMLVVEDAFTIVVVPSTLVDVRQDFERLLDLHEPLFGVVVGVLVRVVL
jgi:hypothetical protein